jgi:hypothetical protein
MVCPVSSLTKVEELESRVEQLNLVIKDSKTLQRQLVKCIEQLKVR